MSTTDSQSADFERDDSQCWRHRYKHREYVCRCVPTVPGDTGREDQIVRNNQCPACGAAEGVRCTTVIDGVDTHWTHDARVYADLGVRHG